MKLTAEQYAHLVSLGLRSCETLDEGFAGSCYDTNSYEELIDFDNGDPTTQEQWGITADEERQGVIDALQWAMFWYEAEHNVD